MPIDYSDIGVTELLSRRNAIDAALDGGSQTMVGIAPGIRHEFSHLTSAELRVRRDEYQYALWLLDPTTYSNPYQRAGITRVMFCR